MGSSRAERLDPFALPLRFVDADFAADGQVRHVELHRERVVLRRADPALSLTLCRACESSDVVADWRAWGRALGVPLLVAQSDGCLREPFARLGGVCTAAPIARRRRRSSLRGRRASIPLRRGRGSLSRMARVHAGEREIIARN